MKPLRHSLALIICFHTLSTAFGGGAEHFCNASGTEVTEGWIVPAGGVTFDFAVLRVVVGGQPYDLYAPNYPDRIANTATGQPNTSWPAVQSATAALAAWNGFTVGGQAISTFAYAPALQFLTLFVGTPASVLGPPNGINTISLFEPAGSFGGAFALATTRVVANASGVISEADIGVNASTTVFVPQTGQNVPAWSFVETNLLAYPNQTFVTHPGATVTVPLGPGTFTEPFFGYADLQGVLTHELGHAAGLAHSLVDAQTSNTSTQIPTMFPIAQGQSAFAGTAQLPQYLAGTQLTAPINAANTQSQGIYGTSARTPTQDDIHAISEAYQGPGFFTGLGWIKGQVRDNFGNPVLGAHVVAISAAAPDAIRVGTLTYAGGTFVIGALPPGTYSLLVEPIDGGGFFSVWSPGPPPTLVALQLPNYVQPPSNCVTPPTFQAEMYDTSGVGGTDPIIEAQPMTVTTFAVAAGAATNVFVNVDLLTTDTLFIADGNSGVFSSHGDMVSLFGTVTSQGVVVQPALVPSAPLALSLNTNPPVPNVTALFSVDIVHGHNIVGGQLLHTSLPGGAFPLLLTANTNVAGSATVPLTATLALKQWEFVCQAAWVNPTLGLTLSNPVKILIP